MSTPSSRPRRRPDGPSASPVRSAGWIAFAAAAALGVGCVAETKTEVPAATRGGMTPEPVGAREVSVPPPLEIDGSAYDAAAWIQLPRVPAGEHPGLHNVYRLSDRIISGGEPLTEEALEVVARWGVKTILSVDGKTPDAETAERLGMRYVHVPIRYSGITEDEVARIAKTFRELEGPFYVHCFHGKHRGPAAAAIGRVAADGISRDVAIAEMRQWCATSGKYEGLYGTVARADIPSATETAAFDFDFTHAHVASGLRDAMVQMARISDDLKLLRANGWQPLAEHPDIDALQSATQLHQLLVASQGMGGEVPDAGDDYFELMDECVGGAASLVEGLTECRQEGGELDASALDAAFTVMNNSCLDCHSGYRNL